MRRSRWSRPRGTRSERAVTHAGYQNAVLRDLARDTPVSHRNLQYAVSFHRAYPTQPKLSLSWGHFRLLLDRPTAEQRLHYQQRAVNEKLTVHQLAAIISIDQRTQGDPSASLPRPALTRCLYEAIVDNVIDGDTLDLRIDVGFEILRQGRFRLASINCPELGDRWEMGLRVGVGWRGAFAGGGGTTQRARVRDDLGSAVGAAVGALEGAAVVVAGPCRLTRCGRRAPPVARG